MSEIQSARNTHTCCYLVRSGHRSHTRALAIVSDSQRKPHNFSLILIRSQIHPLSLILKNVSQNHLTLFLPVRLSISNAPFCKLSFPIQELQPQQLLTPPVHISLEAVDKPSRLFPNLSLQPSTPLSDQPPAGPLSICTPTPAGLHFSPCQTEDTRSTCGFKEDSVLSCCHFCPEDRAMQHPPVNLIYVPSGRSLCREEQPPTARNHVH